MVNMDTSEHLLYARLQTLFRGLPIEMFINRVLHNVAGWSGGAMVLGKLPVPGRPTIWIAVGQGPTALVVGASGGLFGHFYSPLFHSLWETARYRLKYCLKGPLNPKQPTNQST